MGVNTIYNVMSLFGVLIELKKIKLNLESKLDWEKNKYFMNFTKWKIQVEFNTDN